MKVYVVKAYWSPAIPDEDDNVYERTYGMYLLKEKAEEAARIYGYMMDNDPDICYRGCSIEEWQFDTDKCMFIKKTDDEDDPNNPMYLEIASRA